MESKIIGVDFDNTCVLSKSLTSFKNIGAVPVLEYLQRQGHKIVPNSLRGNSCTDWLGNKYKESLIGYCHEWAMLNDFKFDSTNLEKQDWTDANKVHCDLYIDDKALGTPLIEIEGVQVVDWVRVVELLPLVNPEDKLLLKLDVLRNIKDGVCFNL